MRFNLEWLREWVDIGLDGERVAQQLTAAGLEVDAVLPAAPRIEGVKVAEVRTVQQHPNADRLSVCSVFDGESTLEIVCGAPNVRPGIKVPLAPVGTHLPNGVRIKASVIRGIESKGMLCSARELGLADDAAGLLVLDDNAEAGSLLEDHLRLPDEVIDVDLTPNRGDCFSLVGIAREVAARQGVAVVKPGAGTVSAANGEEHRPRLEAPGDCPVFATRVIAGLEPNSRTPDWLKERLRRAGLRAVSPVVDVTNYVMLELGQPLHAYDRAKLSGQIRARRAAREESLELLDGTEIELADDVLVIADDSGAIGLAGVMGGASTAIGAGTVDIVLESAFFAPESIQGRARRYGLHTDASVRFERGVDPAGQVGALERATALLLEITGGTPGPVTVARADEFVPSRVPIALRRTRLEAVLGMAIEAGAAERMLTRLGMNVAPAEGGWIVTPPSHRFDIAIEEDLIEEVGRMLGYDAIPMRAAMAPVRLGSASERRLSLDRAGDLLVSRGYDEIISYSFVAPEADAALRQAAGSAPILANPISAELSALRSSLWPGLVKAAQQNLSRQQARCRLYEIGTVFSAAGAKVGEKTAIAGLVVGPLLPEHWDSDNRDADYFDLKADVVSLLEATGREREFEFRAAEHEALNPANSTAIESGGVCAGWIGSLHPALQRQLDLRKEVWLFELSADSVLTSAVPTYAPFARYPSVRRDLAIVVDESVSTARLIGLITAVLGPTLRRTIVFDQYRSDALGSGRKSLGLGLILQDASRTLTDADTDAMLGSVIQRLEHELGATIRT